MATQPLDDSEANLHWGQVVCRVLGAVGVGMVVLGGYGMLQDHGDLGGHKIAGPVGDVELATFGTLLTIAGTIFDRLLA